VDREKLKKDNKFQKPGKGEVKEATDYLASMGKDGVPYESKTWHPGWQRNSATSIQLGMITTNFKGGTDLAGGTSSCRSGAIGEWSQEFTRV